MPLPAGADVVRARFRAQRPAHIAMAAPFAENPDAVADSAAAAFEAMLPTLPYVDEPDHPMADSALSCAGALSVILALRAGGAELDPHEFGPVMLDALASAEVATAQPTFDELVAAGERSQRDGAPNEFVFAVSRGDDPGVKRKIDMTSCAVCAMCTPHDAMDFVPYMCALDDVVSDAYGQGLRRTGTIALGATHCDFRYTGPAGEPLPLAVQYPERIRTASSPG